MYYIENHHEPIVSKEIFQRVQEEMTRRASKRKVMQKSAKTEQGKYSAKYALSEVLVCGECGTPYKRCTWARNGKKRIVWRCVSRLEFGKKYCHDSPTVDEEKLHRAILAALNECSAIRDEIADSACELARLAKNCGESNGVNLLGLRQRLTDLSSEQALLLDRVLEDMDNPELNAQLKALTDEKQSTHDQIEQLECEDTQAARQTAQMDELQKWLEQQAVAFKEYDDSITRKMVTKITVVDAETV